jgi:hypothetical protein
MGEVLVGLLILAGVEVVVGLLHAGDVGLLCLCDQFQKLITHPLPYYTFFAPYLYS